MKTLLAILLLVTGATAFAEVRTFKIIPGGTRNDVQFRSDAATETVIGKTHTITGFVELDPATDSSPVRGEIHVDLTSLKTGIELRDKHMRENHLETDRFPEVIFTLTSISYPTGSLTESKRTPVRVTGKLRLHGVEREISPESFLTYREAGGVPSLQIESSFTVRLSDYDIKRPQFLVMRLSETQQITVNLLAE